MECPKCAAAVPAGARFCPACGAPQVVAALPEERKLVSILFVDQVGSTARADGADPEDVRDENRAYYQETRERIESFGGTVEKYVGDAVMAVYGAPRARSDDAERAVRAGLSILEGIEALNRRGGVDLHVRVAVGTGDAIVTVDAAPGDALATGDIVNTTARLQTAGPVDGVVVDAATMRLCRDTFAFQPLPAIEAKGKREPLPIWRVLGERPATDRPRSESSFVGRHREMELISSQWARVTEDRRPHVFVVIGPAGIGKTRVGSEVAAEVERAGGRALWGRSLPYEEQSPYRAFGDMIRIAAGVFENDPADVAFEKLARFVAGLFPHEEAPGAGADLAQLLGVVLGDATDDQIRLYFTARRTIELLADRAPLLLVFEDLHWADDALMDLLDYLIRHVLDGPVGFLALTRPELLEERPGFGTGPTGLTRLPLAALAPEEATTLVSSVLASRPYAIRRVVDRAEGNPLFLEELAAAVLGEDDERELPATVRAAIAARIDGLPSRARTALLHASVVGQSFWRGVLERLGSLDDVDGALQDLEDRGLIVRHPQSQVTDDVEYAFRHVLIRDVAYATLPRAIRRTLHAATARLIEGSVPDPADLAWVLALHWREAGDVERALDYLVTAGDRAVVALAVEEAFDRYSRAMDLAGNEDERRRIRLRRALALTDLEDFARADPELEELIPELEGLEAVEAMVARAKATFWRSRTQVTLELAEEAAERARTLGARDLEAVALSRLSATYAMRGGEGDLARGIELGNKVLDDWIPGTRSVYFAEHLFSQADNYYWAGEYEEALEFSEAAREAGGHEPGSLEFELRGSGIRGLALAGLGAYEEAFAAAEAAIDAAHQMGRGDAVVTNYSTLILRELFLPELAAERSAAVADRLGPSDFNMPWLNARADVLAADLLRGDIGAIDRAWAGAWELASTSRAWDRWVVGTRLAAVRAEADLMAGRLDDAVAWSERTLTLAGSTLRRKYRIEGTLSLGRALAARGDTSGALGRLRAAVALADDRGGTPLLRWKTRSSLAAALPDDEGRVPLLEASEIVDTIVANLAPAHAAGYASSPAVVEMRERLG
jgi:class 3 adenylate cyclase/tetratricopeptide (TPR) repeat protein